jgi:hypothetical protein
MRERLAHRRDGAALVGILIPIYSLKSCFSNPITILYINFIEVSMATVTLKAKGLQNEILERMVSLGLASTKKEAIEFALLKTAFDIGLLKSEEIIKFVDKLTDKKRMRPEEVAAEVKRAKNESVH